MRSRTGVGCAGSSSSTRAAAIPRWLSASGRATKRVRVHLLVLEAFRGPRPYRCEALHGNDIPHDNRASNLRWGSRRENLADGRRIIAERLRELQAACLGKELEA